MKNKENVQSFALDNLFTPKRKSEGEHWTNSHTIKKTDSYEIAKKSPEQTLWNGTWQWVRS
jgi:hypothetical protein